MSRIKQAYIYGLLGYMGGIVSLVFLPKYISLGLPALGIAGAIYMLGRSSKAKDAARTLPQAPQEEAAPAVPAAASPVQVRTNPARAESLPVSPLDAEWQQVNEYIGTIEDMVILEGKQHNLDNEIVEKTLSLLSKLNRIIPQLRELNDSAVNHNIKRLVLKDLNGVISPFLSLSGEAKQKNRRLLLNGLKDIDSKMNFYTETIEQKDLLELRTKAELIHQRYNINN